MFHDFVGNLRVFNDSVSGSVNSFVALPFWVDFLYLVSSVFYYLLVLTYVCLIVAGVYIAIFEPLRTRHIRKKLIRLMGKENYETALSDIRKKLKPSIGYLTTDDDFVFALWKVTKAELKMRRL